MPRNVTQRILDEYDSSLKWQACPLMARPKRADVTSGKIVIIEAGNKTLHPIEAKYVRPELHSLMEVDRPVVSPGELDRVVLWVDKPIEEIKGTYAYDYIKWGSKQTFASKKSKPNPVPMRKTCAQRPLWYDLTGLQPGIAFWPKAQKYRHIIPVNPSRISTNCNLYDMQAPELNDTETRALLAILNSTIVALFKHFYGRYAGSEGTLKTEVVDAYTIELPSPVGIGMELTQRLSGALNNMQNRSVTHLVEQPFLDCHTESEMRILQEQPLGLPIELQKQDRRELDLAVFELLGVTDARKRERLVDRLYAETSLYHRMQRIQDIQSSINRTKLKGIKGAGQLELALDAWDHLEPEWQKPLPQWLQENAFAAKTVELPEGEVRLPAPENFLEANTLFLGKKPGRAHECASRPEAELLYQIAYEGVRGPVSIPRGEAQARKLLNEMEHRLVEGRRKMIALAEERAGTDKLREQVVETLYRWFIHGKSAQSEATRSAATTRI